MIRTFPTKQMQRLAADSCGPDSAAAANDTYSDMFRRLAEAAVLAERARPTLSGFKQNEKSIRNICEVAVEKAWSEEAANTTQGHPSVTVPELQKP